MLTVDTEPCDTCADALGEQWGIWTDSEPEYYCANSQLDEECSCCDPIEPEPPFPGLKEFKELEESPSLFSTIFGSDIPEHDCNAIEATLAQWKAYEDTGELSNILDSEGFPIECGCACNRYPSDFYTLPLSPSRAQYNFWLVENPGASYPLYKRMRSIQRNMLDHLSQQKKQEFAENMIQVISNTLRHLDRVNITIAKQSTLSSILLRNVLKFRSINAISDTAISDTLRTYYPWFRDDAWINKTTTQITSLFMRVCKNERCYNPEGLFVPRRSNQVFCEDACRNRHNSLKSKRKNRH